MGAISDNFDAKYKSIMKSSMGADSVYETALSTFTEQVDALGITEEEKAKHLVSLISQMSISISATAMQTTMELVSRDARIEKELSILDKQALTEDARKELLIRQKEGFDDKNRQEAMKGMGGIVSMTATQGTAEKDVLETFKTTLNSVVNKTNYTLPPAVE